VYLHSVVDKGSNGGRSDPAGRSGHENNRGLVLHFGHSSKLAEFSFRAQPTHIRAFVVHVAAVNSCHTKAFEYRFWPILSLKPQKHAKKRAKSQISLAFLAFPLTQ
jgi:hypothetical protein